MYGKSYEDLFNKGIMALKQNAPEKALEYFEKANIFVFDDPELYNSMASAHIQLGEYNKAAFVLSKSLIFDQYNPVTLSNFAILNTMTQLK